MMVIGGKPPLAITIAPISISGMVTRRIGRRLRDRSPVKVDWNGCAASNPVIIRIVEPELPQSSAVCGSRRPSAPRPRMRT